MPESEPTRDALHKLDAMEREVIYLLTDLDQFPPIWSVGDLARELDYFDTNAIIRPLCGAGLIHKTSDGFVFARPAAHRLVVLIGEVV